MTRDLHCNICGADGSAQTIPQASKWIGDHGCNERTAQRPELTFDGCGINGPDEYRTRLATFNFLTDGGKLANKYGPMFAAAPETAAQRDELRDAAGMARETAYDDAPDGGVTITHEAFTALMNALTRAEKRD